MWLEAGNRIRYSESFAGNPWTWDGDFDVSADATPRRFVWRYLKDGVVQDQPETIERIGDSVITTTPKGRSAEYLPGGGLRLPGYIPMPALATLGQCALARGQQGVRTAHLGVVRLMKTGTVRVHVAGKSKNVSLYTLTSDSNPDLVHLWLDEQQRLFAYPSDDVGLELPKDWAPVMEQLLVGEAEWAERQMRATVAALSEKPPGGVVFTHARLIDVERGTAAENMSVVVRGARIVAVGPDSTITPGRDALVIDAAGKTVMPGLWDFNPGDLSDSYSAISDVRTRAILSRGITSVYDIHGDTIFAPRIVRRLESGQQVGPRMLTTCAIFGWVPDLIDGQVSRFRDAPNQVKDRGELRQVISRCAAQGRKWVNTYSTFPPELIPAAIEESEAAGVRFMNTSASKGVGAGKGVSTHVAQALFGIVSVDTNRKDWQLGRVGGAAQFWAYGRAIPDLDLDSPSVRAVVQRFAGGRMPAGTSLCVYPPTNRNMRAHDTTYDAATSKKMMEFVGLVHRAGGTLMPGTEGACSLRRELELLAQTGITNAELLSMATIGTARFAELDREIGSITEGKRADIIMVDGDPLARLADLDRVVMVMRDGALYRDPRALRGERATAQEDFFDSNGVPIRYVEQGRGEAIVLLHGGGAALDGWINSGMLQNLAKDYRVIAFDARGHGKSGKPHDVSAYGPEMGLDVVRLLDHLGVRRAHIVGYSMGAFITAQLLTAHPERFLTATLGGAPGWFQWTDTETADAELEASEKERECVSRTQIYRGTPANQPKPDEAEIKRRSDACLADPNMDRFAQAALVRARKDNAITPAQVAAENVPTLGVVGSLDNYLSGFQELKKLRPGMKLVVIDGATHQGERGALRRPEFLATVRAFIDAHKTKSSR